MTNQQKLYGELLQKIEDLSKRQLEKFGDQITCREGCDECCHPPDSLFQVEAEILEQAISALDADTQKRIKERLEAYEAGKRLFCPLLEEHKCLVYEGRPSICRTQGFALWLPSSGEEEDSEENRLSWCSLNFKSETPTRVDAFDVPRLNTMLSLMTQLGWKEQPARRELIEIIGAGLKKL